jgi:nucleoside 2-deoxyribosyltransferase
MDTSEPGMATIFPLRNLRRVYCAGPLFNEAERQEMLQIAEVLKHSGFEPFVPHADGMEFAKLEPYLGRRFDRPQLGQWLHSAIFALDTYQVVIGCGSLVFNMNGRVPDEGAVAESTMAWMLGKPIVLFKEDARSAIVGRDNPLVVGPASFETVAGMDQLGEVLADKLARHPLGADWQMTCPPHLEATLRSGAKLWRALCSLGDSRDISPVADVVLELFGPDATPAVRIDGHTDGELLTALV